MNRATSNSGDDAACAASGSVSFRQRVSAIAVSQQAVHAPQQHSATLSTLYADLHKELLMRRATPLGHEQKASANERENHPNPTPIRNEGAVTPVADEQQNFPRPFSVVRGGHASTPRAEHEPRSRSGEHHRRHTPIRALIQPSDPERLRRALEAMREMNKLTRQRTEEMRKLSVLSRELSTQMKEFGSVIGGLRIGPERRSAG